MCAVASCSFIGVAAVQLHLRLHLVALEPASLGMQLLSAMDNAYDCVPISGLSENYND